ncbi:uncharacterized protein ACRADG_006144 [Cochliomyia hominivorax]
MATKSILAILAVTLFLLQGVLAKPASTSVDHFKDSNLCKVKDIYEAFKPVDDDKDLTPSLKILKVMMLDLMDLTLTYVKKNKVMMEQLLNESAVKTATTQEMKKFKQNLEDFLKKYNSCSEMKQLFELLKEYSDITLVYYESEAKGHLKPEEKLILDVLKKHHVKELDDEFDEKFINTLVNDFGKKITEKKNELQHEVGGVGPKILKWWDEVKEMKTPEEKLKAFEECIKLYAFIDEDDKE